MFSGITSILGFILTVVSLIYFIRITPPVSKIVNSKT